MIIAMYCKKCGKQIEDDAQYCKYCGEHVGTDALSAPKKSIVEWFQSKSRNTRLVMIIGMIWLFIGICFLFVCEYAEEYLTVFVIFAGVPLVGWSLWYYFKYLRKGRKKRSEVNKSANIENTSTDDSTSQSNLIPLLVFAKENGHMQVGTYASEDTGIIKARCLFTKTTYVDFSSALGELTAAEIAEKKEKLYVKRIDDDSLELILQE